MESIKKYSNNEVDILSTLSGYISQYFKKSDDTNAAYQTLQESIRELTLAIPPEITSRNKEFNSIDQVAVEACRGRHWATGFQYMHFADCTEKLNGKRYQYGEVKYLETSANKF